MRLCGLIVKEWLRLRSLERVHVSDRSTVGEMDDEGDAVSGLVCDMDSVGLTVRIHVRDRLLDAD